MPDDNPLPWSDRQWDELRAVALEAARKSRVASTFLPLVGPFPADQATVPSNWLEYVTPTGSTDPRLEVRAGRTLQLVTLSCNIYLRGSEIADPDLDAAKSMVRRAGEVLGRLEDAVIFYGIPPAADPALVRGPVIQPEIYDLTGGRDLCGLLLAPSEFAGTAMRPANTLPPDIVALRNAAIDRAATLIRRGVSAFGIQQAEDRYDAAEQDVTSEEPIMSVRPDAPTAQNATPIFDAIVKAIEKLEARGHFGPFAVVLGHELFSAATSPSNSLVLPTDRLAEFLDGRRVQRSGVLPRDSGVVVALGGQPIELVLASDIDVRFLQATLEPRYVLRVFERLVLRIKELDAVCVVTTAPRRLDPEILARRAR